MKLLKKLLKSDQSACKSNVTATASSTKLKRSHCRDSRHKNRNSLNQNTKHNNKNSTTTGTASKRSDNNSRLIRLHQNENRSKISYDQIGVVMPRPPLQKPLLPQFGGTDDMNRFLYGNHQHQQQHLQMICDQLVLNRRQPSSYQQESSNFYQNNNDIRFKKVDLNEHYYQQTVCNRYIYIIIVSTLCMYVYIYFYYNLNKYTTRKLSLYVYSCTAMRI